MISFVCQFLKTKNTLQSPFISHPNLLDRKQSAPIKLVLCGNDDTKKACFIEHLLNVMLSRTSASNGISFPEKSLAVLDGFLTAKMSWGLNLSNVSLFIMEWPDPVSISKSMSLDPHFPVIVNLDVVGISEGISGIA